MSAQLDAIVTRLTSDSTLMASLTGGVHKYNTLPTGLTRDSLPTSAFDTAGYMKPLALVLSRSENRWGGMYDGKARAKSVRNVVEIYIGKDAGGVATTLDTAALSVEWLLDGVFVGVGWMKIINRIDDIRFGEMDNAIFYRLDFQTVYNKYLT